MVIDPLIAMLIGHLIGDFLVQNDYMARSKFKSSWVCLLHVVTYTFSVCLLLATAGHLLPATSPLVILLIAVPHFLIDRFRLARRMMSWGQEEFATGAMAPWSVVVTDQCWHALSLFLVAVFAC